MPVETIFWYKGKVRLVDQTLLPLKFKYISCGDIKTLWRAIKRLQVRGAPAIGIAGALGVIIGTKDSRARNFKQFFEELKSAVKYIGSSRPTAVNLFWALDRMEETAYKNRTKTIKQIAAIIMTFTDSSTPRFFISFTS